MFFDTLVVFLFVLFDDNLVVFVFLVLFTFFSDTLNVFLVGFANGILICDLIGFSFSWVVLLFLFSLLADTWAEFLVDFAIGILICEFVGFSIGLLIGILICGLFGLLVGFSFGFLVDSSIFVIFCTLLSIKNINKKKINNSFIYFMRFIIQKNYYIKNNYLFFVIKLILK